MADDAPVLPPRNTEELSADALEVTAPAPLASETTTATADSTSHTTPKASFSVQTTLTPYVDQLNTAASNVATSATNAFAQINKGLAKVRQFASETIGTAEKTEFSEEYRLLETQFDKVKTVYENLAKVATLFILPGAITDVKMSVANTVENVVTSVHAVPDKSIVDGLRAIDLPKNSASQILGAQFVRNGASLGEDSNFGTALVKCGDAQDKLGRAKLQMNVEIYEKFVKPIEHAIDTSIRSAQYSRRGANLARLQLDTAKLRLKEAKPEKLQQLQDEVQAAQLQFDFAIEESSRLMKAAINSNEGLASLADFTQAMLSYYRHGFQLLEELAPEIDAMKVQQESTTSDK